jgi:hypothetical protein
VRPRSPGLPLAEAEAAVRPGPPGLTQAAEVEAVRPRPPGLAQAAAEVAVRSRSPGLTQAAEVEAVRPRSPGLPRAEAEAAVRPRSPGRAQAAAKVAAAVWPRQSAAALGFVLRWAAEEAPAAQLGAARGRPPAGPARSARPVSRRSRAAAGVAVCPGLRRLPPNGPQAQAQHGLAGVPSAPPAGSRPEHRRGECHEPRQRAGRPRRSPRRSAPRRSTAHRGRRHRY